MFLGNFRCCHSVFPRKVRISSEKYGNIADFWLKSKKMELLKSIILMIQIFCDCTFYRWTRRQYGTSHPRRLYLQEGLYENLRSRTLMLDILVDRAVDQLWL